VHGVQTDVSKPDQLDDLAKQILSKYEVVHVLCNNAGILVGGITGWKSSLADWWLVGVNFMCVVHGLRSFLPIMVEQGSEAHIVNTASLAGLIAASDTSGVCQAMG
jgi:NADP-dependent 3-hydroxy acid dehydrogenase YdfG